MPHDSSLEVDHLSARTGGSVPSHGLDVITHFTSEGNGQRDGRNQMENSP